MQLSCALVTNVDSPELVEEAERLGYRRAWLYDSPAITSDVWMALALAAQRTSTIGLGPGVLVPSLRHPMTNAAAIAGLAAIAPGRVAVAVGSGFTGRYTLGKRPLRWAFVKEYVTALRALLRGETVQWDGAPIRMLHTDGFLADRPVDVEVLIGADGPRGTAVAERVGDGVFAAGVPNPAAAGRPYSFLQFGTVLDEGEDVRSRDVMNRAGHGLAVVFHALYERNGADALLDFPGGREWVDAIEAIPAAERHLVTHEGHLVRLTAVDEEAVGLAADLLPQFTFSGTKAQLRERVAEYAAGGVTELVYQPAGSDVVGELARMMDAVGDVTER
ncbi:MAG TPA: LLM class flavin-dependent oxidoreductase [Mycobacterium sp.]|jgi:5,10-methylenetetrahydromethanopterin reductase|nr:LLM class flavin-dependent oxidoreductase [Mycobacterium sp.]